MHARTHIPTRTHTQEIHAEGYIVRETDREESVTMNNCVIRDDHSRYTNALRIPAVFWNPKVFLGFSTFWPATVLRACSVLPIVAVNHYSYNIQKIHTHANVMHR